jgi:hypothetical protein
MTALLELRKLTQRRTNLSSRLARVVGQIETTNGKFKSQLARHRDELNQALARAEDRDGGWVEVSVDWTIAGRCLSAELFRLCQGVAFNSLESVRATGPR